jgi:hypothetical protein
MTYEKGHEGGFPKGPFHPNWKGGKTHQNGNILILAPNHPHAHKGGYVFEHRLIVEKEIGRYLLPREMIVHLNRDNKDNRPGNLIAFTSFSALQRFRHNPDTVKSGDIIFDGRKL